MRISDWSSDVCSSDLTGPELIPALATEVPTLENGLISEDGLTYTFPIRQGVKFHDGSDLTAQDVKFSWDRVMTMDLPEGAADTLIDIVAETEVADDHTFRVMLKRSEEHTSELQSLMRISYAVFCLK